MANSLVEMVSALQKLEYAVVSAHTFPDADAVSSAVGLAYLMRACGVFVEIYFPEEVPATLKPLLAEIDYLTEPPSRDGYALVVSDTAALDRIAGGAEVILRGATKTFNIDHHISNTLWADFNYIDSESAASAAIVCRMLQHLQIVPDTNTANLLYAGILDDTGRFCFSNVNARSLRVAADLVEWGADSAKIAERLYFSVSPQLLKLQGLVLETLQVTDNGQVATVIVDIEMLEACGLSLRDTDDIVDIPRSVDGASIALYFKQVEPDVWKASLRAKSLEYDVSAVAKQFGGGGHKAAAGCTLHGSKESITSSLLDAVRAIL